MLASPAGTGLRLALEAGVGIAHDSLPQVVETVGRMVCYFLCQVARGGREVLNQVRQAVKLVKYGNHVDRLGMAAWRIIWFRQIKRLGILNLDISPTI